MHRAEHSVDHHIWINEPVLIKEIKLRPGVRLRQGCQIDCRVGNANAFYAYAPPRKRERSESKIQPCDLQGVVDAQVLRAKHYGSRTVDRHTRRSDGRRVLVTSEALQ